MDDTERKQITDANEDRVREWFEASGFASKRLDTKGNNKPSRCDWLFTKQDLSVFCEVKTIFSFVQSGLTDEQFKRIPLDAKRKQDSDNGQRIPQSDKLISNEAELSHQGGKGVTQESFREFRIDIIEQILEDSTLNQLPFSLEIKLDKMYIIYGAKRTQFIEWLKQCIREANQDTNSEHQSWVDIYALASRGKLPDSAFQEEYLYVQAIVTRLDVGSRLKVDFNDWGVVYYHEVKFFETINDKAIPQLRLSLSEAITPTVLPIIALWSGEEPTEFLRLLALDHLNDQLGYAPRRYYLIDWAFSEYAYLVAIILFVPPVYEHPMFGFVITNPNMPEVEKTLRETITENFRIITGLPSDPLIDQKD